MTAHLVGSVPRPRHEVGPARDEGAPGAVRPVQLLWTGGWDSSFRLLELTLVQGRVVRPTYVIDPMRASVLHEIRAMEAIRAGIEARGAGRLVAPTEVFVRTHFPTPPRIAELYRSVARQVHVGEQYRWLAAIAEAQRWSGVELSMTRFENAPPLQALIFGDDGVLRQTEEAELFRYWSFPLLHVAKEQMARTAERHGFLDVLSQRWFCFTPVLDKPCGYCRPCRLAYREGVDFAHPALAWAARNVRRGRRLSRTDVRDKLRERLGRAVDSAAARR